VHLTIDSPIKGGGRKGRDKRAPLVLLLREGEKEKTKNAGLSGRSRFRAIQGGKKREGSAKIIPRRLRMWH